MKIVADENIPYAVEAYSALGEVHLAPGRAIDRAMLDGADALVVRSITKVNAELLDGTAVRFVGTCTIGEDHIDKAYLASHGIAFSSAPPSCAAFSTCHGNGANRIWTRPTGANPNTSSHET